MHVSRGFLGADQKAGCGEGGVPRYQQAMVWGELETDCEEAMWAIAGVQVSGPGARCCQPLLRQGSEGREERADQREVSGGYQGQRDGWTGWMVDSETDHPQVSDLQEKGPGCEPRAGRAGCGSF